MALDLARQYQPQRSSLPRARDPGADALIVNPALPSYKARIQPPAPDEPPPPAAMQVVTPPVAPTSVGAAPVGGQRLIVSWSRDPVNVVVGIEAPPDWEIDETYQVPFAHLVTVAPILRRVGVKIRDMTGELQPPLRTLQGVTDDAAPASLEHPLSDGPAAGAGAADTGPAAAVATPEPDRAVDRARRGR